MMTSSINSVTSADTGYLDALIETMEIAPSDGWCELSVEPSQYLQTLSLDVVPAVLISAAEAAVRRYWCV